MIKNSGMKYLDGLDPDPTGTISYADACTASRLAYNQAVKQAKQNALNAYRNACKYNADTTFDVVDKKCSIYGKCETCEWLDNYDISLQYIYGERTAEDAEK